MSAPPVVFVGRRLAVLALAVSAVLALTPGAASAALRWRDCANVDGFECGILRVPVDRTGAVKGTIPLHVAREKRTVKGGQVFISLSGGNHSIATSSVQPGIIGLFGRGSNTALDSSTGLGSIIVGQDQPLQKSGTGAFLSMSNGATANTFTGLFVDTALLTATAPLLELTGGASLTTASDAISCARRKNASAYGSCRPSMNTGLSGTNQIR